MNPCESSMANTAETSGTSDENSDASDTELINQANSGDVRKRSKKNVSNDSDTSEDDDHVFKPYEKEKKADKPTRVQSNSYIWQIITVILLISGIIMYYNNEKSQPSTKCQKDRVNCFIDDMREIKKKFPQQSPRAWCDIEVGIRELMKPSETSWKPWTFILISNETRTVSCLAESLGEVSSRALQSEQSLILEPKDIGIDYGEMIDFLKAEVEIKKVAVVHNILDIHPGAIQIFHTLCDRENPLVSGSVYILTIITTGSVPTRNLESFVENLLTTRFSNKVHEDKLQPLITRIMDGPLIPVIPGKIPEECSR